MGYYAYTTQTDFYIPPEKLSLLLWDRQLASPDDLLNLFACEGFYVELGGSSSSPSITGIYSEYQKYYDDEVSSFLRSIHPYVDRGSFIGFVGEDDSHWAFYFGEKDVDTYSGYIIYNGMDDAGPVSRRPCETEVV